MDYFAAFEGGDWDDLLTDGGNTLANSTLSDTRFKDISDSKGSTGSAAGVKLSPVLSEQNDYTHDVSTSPPPEHFDNRSAKYVRPASQMSIYGKRSSSVSSSFGRTVSPSLSSPRSQLERASVQRSLSSVTPGSDGSPNTLRDVSSPTGASEGQVHRSQSNPAKQGVAEIIRPQPVRASSSRILNTGGDVRNPPTVTTSISSSSASTANAHFDLNMNSLVTDGDANGNQDSSSSLAGMMIQPTSVGAATIGSSTIGSRNDALPLAQVSQNQESHFASTIGTNQTRIPPPRQPRLSVYARYRGMMPTKSDVTSNASPQGKTDSLPVAAAESMNATSTVKRPQIHSHSQSANHLAQTALQRALVESNSTSEKQKQIIMKLASEMDQLKSALKAKEQLENSYRHMIENVSRTENELRTLKLEKSMHEMELEQLREQLDEQKKAFDLSKQPVGGALDTRTSLTPKKRAYNFSPPRSQNRVKSNDTTDQLSNWKRRRETTFTDEDYDSNQNEEDSRNRAESSSALKLLEGFDVEAALIALEEESSKPSLPNSGEAKSFSGELERVVETMMTQFTPDKRGAIKQAGVQSLKASTVKKPKTDLDAISDASGLSEERGSNQVRRNLESVLEQVGEATYPDKSDLNANVDSLPMIECLQSDENLLDSDALYEITLDLLTTRIGIGEVEATIIARRVADHILSLIPNIHVQHEFRKKGAPTPNVDGIIGSKRSREYEQNTESGTDMLGKQKIMDLLFCRLQYEIRWQHVMYQIISIYRGICQTLRSHIHVAAVSSLILGPSSDRTYDGRNVRTAQSNMFNSAFDGSSNNHLELEINIGVNSNGKTEPVETICMNKEDSLKKSAVEVRNFLALKNLDKLSSFALHNSFGESRATLYESPKKSGYLLSHDTISLTMSLKAILRPESVPKYKDMSKDRLVWLQPRDYDSEQESAHFQKYGEHSSSFLKTPEARLAKMRRIGYQSRERREIERSTGKITRSLPRMQLISPIDASIFGNKPFGHSQPWTDVRKSKLPSVFSIQKGKKEELNSVEFEDAEFVSIVSLIDPLYLTKFDGDTQIQIEGECDYLPFGLSEQQKPTLHNLKDALRDHQRACIRVPFESRRSPIEQSPKGAPNGPTTQSFFGVGWLPRISIEAIYSQPEKIKMIIGQEKPALHLPLHGHYTVYVNCATDWNLAIGSQPLATSKRSILSKVLNLKFLCPNSIAKEIEGVTSYLIKNSVSSYEEISATDAVIHDIAGQMIKAQRIEQGITTQDSEQFQEKRLGVREIENNDTFEKKPKNKPLLSFTECLLTATNRIALHLASTFSPFALNRKSDSVNLDDLLPLGVLETVSFAQYVAHRSLCRCAFILTDSIRLLTSVMCLKQTPLLGHLDYRRAATSNVCESAVQSAVAAVELIGSLLSSLPKLAVSYIHGMSTKRRMVLGGGSLLFDPSEAPMTLIQVETNQPFCHNSVKLMKGINALGVAQRISSGNSSFRIFANSPLSDDSVLETSMKYDGNKNLKGQKATVNAHSRTFTYEAVDDSFSKICHEPILRAISRHTELDASDIAPLPNLIGTLLSILGCSGVFSDDLPQSIVRLFHKVTSQCEGAILSGKAYQGRSSVEAVDLLNAMVPLITEHQERCLPFACAVSDSLLIHAYSNHRIVQRDPVKSSLFSHEMRFPEKNTKMTFNDGDQTRGQIFEYLRSQDASDSNLMRFALWSANNVSTAHAKGSFNPPLMVFPLCRLTSLETHQLSFQILLSYTRIIRLLHPMHEDSQNMRIAHIFGNIFSIPTELAMIGVPLIGAQPTQLGIGDIGLALKTIFNEMCSVRVASEAAVSLIKLCRELKKSVGNSTIDSSQKTQTFNAYQWVESAALDTLILIKRIIRRAENHVSTIVRVQSGKAAAPSPTQNRGVRMNLLDLLFTRMLLPILPAEQISGVGLIEKYMVRYEQIDKSYKAGVIQNSSTLGRSSEQQGLSSEYKQKIKKLADYERNEIVRMKHRKEGMHFLSAITSTSYGVIPSASCKDLTIKAELDPHFARFAARCAWLRWCGQESQANESGILTASSMLSNEQREVFATLSSSIWPNHEHAQPGLGFDAAIFSAFFPETKYSHGQNKLGGTIHPKLEPVLRKALAAASNLPNLIPSAPKEEWTTLDDVSLLATSIQSSIFNSKSHTFNSYSSPETFAKRSLDTELVAVELRSTCVELVSTFVNTVGAKGFALSLSTSDNIDEMDEAFHANRRMPQIAGYSLSDLRTEFMIASEHLLGTSANTTMDEETEKPAKSLKRGNLNSSLLPLERNGVSQFGFDSIVETATKRPTPVLIGTLEPNVQDLWNVLESFHRIRSSQNSSTTSSELNEMYRGLYGANFVKWCPDKPIELTQPSMLLLALEYAHADLQPYRHCIHPIAILSCILAQEVSVLKKSESKLEFVKSWLSNIMKLGSIEPQYFLELKNKSVGYEPGGGQLAIDTLTWLDRVRKNCINEQSWSYSILLRIVKARRRLVEQTCLLLTKILTTKDSRCATLHSLLDAAKTKNVSDEDKIFLRPVPLPWKLRHNLVDSLSIVLSELVCIELDTKERHLLSKLKNLLSAPFNFV